MGRQSRNPFGVQEAAAGNPFSANEPAAPMRILVIAMILAYGSTFAPSPTKMQLAARRPPPPPRPWPWFGGRRLSSRRKKVSRRCWCALTPAPRCVRLTRAPHASAELVRPPLAHARPSREPQRLPVPHIRPPGAHHRCLCHNQSPFRSIVSCLHTPLPPPLRVPQVRLRAEREAAEWRFFWLSFFAGMVITSVFV